MIPVLVAVAGLAGVYFLVYLPRQKFKDESERAAAAGGGGGGDLFDAAGGLVEGLLGGLGGLADAFGSIRLPGSYSPAERAERAASQRRVRALLLEQVDRYLRAGNTSSARAYVRSQGQLLGVEGKLIGFAWEADAESVNNFLRARQRALGLPVTV